MRAQSPFQPILAAGAFVLLMASPARASSVTHNGVSMPVETVVALWDEEFQELTIQLFPIALSEQEIASIQRGRSSFVHSKPSPDPARWPSWIPHVSYQLSWPIDPGSIGDHDAAKLFVFAYGIDRQNSNLNLNFFAGDHPGNLQFPQDGPGGRTVGSAFETGSEIALSAKSEIRLDEDHFAWDLDLSARVLPRIRP